MIFCRICFGFGESFTLYRVEVEYYGLVVIFGEFKNLYRVGCVMAVKWPPIVYPDLIEKVAGFHYHFEHIPATLKSP